MLKLLAESGPGRVGYLPIGNAGPDRERAAPGGWASTETVEQPYNEAIALQNNRLMQRRKAATGKAHSMDAVFGKRLPSVAYLFSRYLSGSSQIKAISLPHRLVFGGINRSASKLGVLGSRDRCHGGCRPASTPARGMMTLWAGSG